MLGLFKKRTWKIEGKAFDFFNILFARLPGEFHFLSEGLQKGLYKRFSVNHATKEHHYSVGFDASQSDKSMVKGRQFDLNHILVIEGPSKFPLNITIYEGIWVGFEIERNILDFTDYQFDLSQLQKNKSPFTNNQTIRKLVNGLHSEDLNLDDLSEIEVNGKYYYQIKDLEDGNYIAIDNKGQVFGLIHDPYKIELINKSIVQFVDDVNDGRFNFDRYLDGKI